MKTLEIIDEDLRYFKYDSVDEDIDDKLDDIMNSNISFLKILISILGNISVDVRPNKIFYIDCPFHNTEDMPLYIDDVNKVYNCFSCGEKGTLITFIYKYYGIYPKSAINILYAFINNDLDELDKDEIVIFKDIFEKYCSKEITKITANYLRKSTYKTNYLNKRIDNYIDNSDKIILDIDKISNRLCCSKKLVKDRILNRKSNN